jgi:hypothetical protein
VTRTASRPCEIVKMAVSNKITIQFKLLEICMIIFVLFTFVRNIHNMATLQNIFDFMKITHDSFYQGTLIFLCIATSFINKFNFVCCNVAILWLNYISHCVLFSVSHRERNKRTRDSVLVNYYTEWPPVVTLHFASNFTFDIYIYIHILNI